MRELIAVNVERPRMRHPAFMSQRTMIRPSTSAAEAIRLASRGFLWSFAGLTAAMAAALSPEHAPTCLGLAAPHCAFCYAAGAAIVAALTAEIAVRR